MFYLVLIVAIVALFFYVKHPKRLQKIMPYLKQFWDWLLPDEWHEQQGGLTKSVIKALNDTSTLSKMILLHSYEQKSDDFGIYNLCTGRRAIGFKITPPPHVGDSTIKLIKSAFKTIDIKNVAVQISTYASDNISEYLEAIEANTQEDINVLNASSLKMMRDDRIQKMKKWAKSSMLDNGADFRARNLISFMTVIFPKDTSIAKIRSIYGQIQGVLTDLSPEPLSPKLVVSLYGEIFKEDFKLKDYDPHQRMNVQLVKGARVRVNNENSIIHIGEKTYAKVLTTDKFPKHTTPLDVQNAFFDLEGEFQNPLPCRFLTTLTVHIDDPDRLKEKILKRARANVSAEKKIPDGTYALMPKIKKTMQESHNIIQYIDEDKEPIYEGMYSLTIFENSPEKLDNAIGRIKTKFASIDFGGWEIAQEDYGIVALQVLLWSMPFQFDLETKNYLNRYNLMFSSNISAIVPLIGSFKGIGSPILRFLGRSGQVVGLDLWASDSNYNACIIGPSGTGKSFLSNSIQASNAQAGVRSMIFDIGKSYKPLCDEIGGEFIHFSKENSDGSANAKCLNFFTNIVTEKVHIEGFEGQSIQAIYEVFPLAELAVNGYVEMIEEDAFSSMVIIVGAMCGRDLSMKDDVAKESSEAQMAALIEGAIQVAFYRRGRDAGMRDVGEALKGFAKEAEVRRHDRIVDLIQDMILALEPYITEGGKFYTYYNGAYNINVKNDFCVIELEELAPKVVLYFIVFMSMLERAAQEMFLDSASNGKGQRKSVIIDEAAPVLANFMFAKYLDDFARRVRKYNGSLTVITQNPADFLHNVNSKAVWVNTTHKFILELNASKVEQNFAENGLFFGYGDFRKKQMTSVKNRAPHYSEVMYIYNDKVSEVLLLKATPQEAAMFTTNPKDKNLKLEFQKEFGLTPQEATKMLGFHKEGLDKATMLARLKEGDRSSTVKYWMEKIRNAINQDLVEPQSQMIIDDSGTPAFYEVHLYIRDARTNELYGFKDFGEVALEQDMMPLLARKCIQKALDFYSKKNFVFSINVMIEEISHEHLKNLISILGDYADNVILEIPASAFESKEDKERSVHFCNKAREAGFMIAIDHLNFDNFTPGLVKAIEPTVLKIDGELIMAAQNDNDKLMELKAMSPIAKALNINILAAHIENRSLLNLARKLEFNFYQGRFINEPNNMLENFAGQGYQFQMQEEENF